MKFKYKKTAITILVFSLIIFFPTYTPKIRDENNRVVKNSIAELSKIKLGGVNQSVMIRGKNKDNPIILFLHGGPGYPFIGYARKFQRKLEEDFIVVNWDQRGSGKSFSPFIDKTTMTQEQLEKDTLDLINYLLEKFNKEKVFIVGHSWGTVLGIETIQNAPEKVHAYIGIGQVVDDHDGEIISYNYTLEEAREDENEQALQELAEIGIPPYEDSTKDTFVQRKWLKKYGGFEKEVITLDEIKGGILFSPEYSWIDGGRFLLGNMYSINTVLNNRDKVDFRQKYQTFEVPMYFCAGRYDYNTPSVIVEEYFNIINAPKKKFYWFEKSAHEPHLVEEEKFANIMLDILMEIINNN